MKRIASYGLAVVGVALLAGAIGLQVRADRQSAAEPTDNVGAAQLPPCCAGKVTPTSLTQSTEAPSPDACGSKGACGGCPYSASCGEQGGCTGDKNDQKAPPTVVQSDSQKAPPNGG